MPPGGATTGYIFGAMAELHEHPRGEPHDHSHPHHAALHSVPVKWLLYALVLTATFLVVEVVAGFLSGSLALLSDAVHMLTDAGALGLALWAQILAARVRTGRRTFGYRRAEILAALINGTVLGVSAVWIVIEGMRRLRRPEPIEGGIMLVVATLGLAVNLLSAWLLSRGDGRNINLRAATAHVLSDAAGSAGAIVAALAILLLGPQAAVADPAVSLFIAALIFVGAWRLVREAVDVLMEGTPAHVDLAWVESVIRQTPGVAGFHDLHVWSISEGFPMVTVHVELASGHHGTDVAKAVATRIQQVVGIPHVTVQPEVPDPDQLVPAHTLSRERPPR